MMMINPKNNSCKLITPELITLRTMDAINPAESGRAGTPEMLAMRLHALARGESIQPLTDLPEPLTDLLENLQPFPLQLELSQPLINHLERLTATR